MSSTKAGPAALSGEKFVRLFGLIEQADSVELKLTVPEWRR